MRLLKILIALFALSYFSASASAQSCNDPSGFLKSFGTIPIGNLLALGPDCQHVLDSGTSAISGFVVNVKNPPYNATGNGTTDDFAAIQAADAAAALNGQCVYFPAGTYIVSQTLNPVRSNLCWFGDGRYNTTIKLKSASAFDTVVWLGPRTATTQVLNNDVRNIGFSGNGGATNAVFQLRNVSFSLFKNLIFQGGVAHGMRSDTSTTTINTLALRNHYENLESANNGGKGFYFNGEKDSEIAEIFSHNNTGDGIYFGPANLNSSALCETTQLYGGHISARDNLGDGVVFDEAEKYAFSSVQTSINGGYGIRFKSTITGCTSTGSNSVSIADVVARNDSLGGFRVSDGAYMYGAKFGSVWIRGDNSTVGTNAMLLDGVAHTAFGSVQIEGWPGNAVIIEQGTPLGSLTQSNAIQFANITLGSNGNVGAPTNFGLQILNSSSIIQIGQLISANLQTSGTNYELAVSSGSSSIFIGDNLLNASGGVGNNYNIANTSTYTHAGTFNNRAPDGSAAGPAFSFATDPTTGFFRAGSGLQGYAQSGTERIRFGGGLMVGTTIDPGVGRANVLTGYRIGNAAAAGNILQGNGTDFVSTPQCPPNIQVFSTGTNATYTTPTCNGNLPLYLEGEITGGGGGGGGSGTTPGTATAGGNSCWNTSGTACTSPIYQASGGGFGNSGAPGTGGSAGAISGSGTCTESFAGQAGLLSSGGGGNPGGSGGGNIYGPGGFGGNIGNSSGGPFAGTAATNAGGGGGGASMNATANGGSGGGSSPVCRFQVTSPAASYVYTIGAAGAGATAGTSGAAGGNGFVGRLRVTARWF